MPENPNQLIKEISYKSIQTINKEKGHTALVIIFKIT